MLTLTGPERYKVLYQRYTQGKDTMTTNEVMELFQFMLDTDQVWDDDKLSKIALYYISEGFLYNVECNQ